MLKGFITNLGKYNEGILIGEWVEFPLYEDELTRVLKKIGINKNYEEYFFSDWDTDIPELHMATEFSDIEELNDFVERYEVLDSDQILAVEAYLEAINDNLGEALECAEAREYRICENCEDMTDVAYAIVEESGILFDVPEMVAKYFNYKQFGIDLGTEDCFAYIADEHAMVQILLE